MKIYAIAIWAQRDNDYVVLPVLTMGPKNRLEAQAEGMNAARDRFPLADGWTDHRCSVAEAVAAVHVAMQDNAD